MKRLQIFLVTFILLLSEAQAQNSADQLFLLNGEVVTASIKKIDVDAILYTYIGEDLENVVVKDEVQKIIFKNGREQKFSAAIADRVNINYQAMREKEGAVLPFEFVFDGNMNSEEGFEAQEYYCNNLMRKPERNTISYQDIETTRKRLRAAGIQEAIDMRDYEMSEIAKIVGTGLLVTGKIVVDYRSTTSSTSGSTTTRVDTKKKKVKSYSSDYSTSSDEFDTKVVFQIFDKNGNKLVNETRRPFLATTRNNYMTALNYLMKRTPYYQKK